MARRLIVEADGGSRGNPGPAAYGTVVREAATGEVLFEEGTTIGVDTNNVAEYRGLIAGLLAVRQIDAAAEVEARLDSKLIVEQMSGRWKIKHENMRRLALQARDAFPPASVSYVWVPREQNKAADALVNSALDGMPIRRTRGLTSAPDEPTDAEPQRATNTLTGWSEAHPVVTTTTLLRHGETRHTVDKRFSGWGGDDPPLSEVGRDQALRAGRQLADAGGADLLVVSPMLRARETAELVAQSVSSPIVIEHDLRECAFGEWDGLTFAEVQASDGVRLAEWLAATSLAPPGGESFDQVSNRVASARDRLIAEHAGTTMVWVTHVTPLKTMVRLALDAPSHSLFRMFVAPASLTSIQWFGDGHASVNTFNQTSHLHP